MPDRTPHDAIGNFTPITDAAGVTRGGYRPGHVLDAYINTTIAADTSTATPSTPGAGPQWRWIAAGVAGVALLALLARGRR